MLQNLHTHTVHCDGIDTVENMCESAIRLGFDSLGFSSHSPCLLPRSKVLTDVPAYVAAVRAAQKKYEGELKIYLGCEMDALSTTDFDRTVFDYTIASVHGAFKDGVDIYFDYSLDIARNHIEKDFGGDALAFAELYFKTMLTLPQNIGGDIVGHFDLITKYSEISHELIPFESRAYRDMALDTLRTMRKSYEIFEVNVGAINKNYRTRPYPSPFILEEMKALKCKLILTSDCHDARMLKKNLPIARDYVLSHGISEIYYLTDGGFVKERL